MSGEKHYTEHDDVVKMLTNHGKVVMQQRPKRYKFGTKNYGEVPGVYNHADGDAWDVFAPGYSFLLHTNRTYRCKHIIGTYILENGNHKIAVRLYIPGYDECRARKEIARYCAEYTKFTRVQGTWVSYS